MEDAPLVIQESLDGWVIDKAREWRDHYEANYSQRFDEYYRIWRGIWAPEDKTRGSERSRIIAPATQQAVESSVAEMEEATFGRGRWFDIRDNMDDPENEDIEYLKKKLHEDFERTKIRKAVSECLINAAVFGTGVGEIVLDSENTMTPASEPVMGGDLTAIGVNIQEKVTVRLRPVLPQNFLIDPVATDVQEAMGVAIDEFVPKHSVEILQEQGVYRDEHLGTAPNDEDLEPDQSLVMYQDDKVRLTRYYGLVPTDLLKEEVDAETMPEDEQRYTEAIVVIANNGILLKAEANPYMMQDRPVVAFPWDVVPGRFWGRGVCEKGYNSQKALDAELRGRIDALSLTIHPMMGMDATRIPRGTSPEVRPGKLLMTNGDPNEILRPFTFGDVSQITFAQAQALQDMVQQATGAVDSTGVAGAVNGEATAAGISMSLGAIIKRHKRTLINFQESFLIPLVAKAAWRYMQFSPDEYPVSDYRFEATSTLGIIAREYEVTQLVQLLQTMSPDSPLYPTLIQSIIDNMNLSNREELKQAMEQASQPDPQQVQMQQETHAAQMAYQQAQTKFYEGEAQSSQAQAMKYISEARAKPISTETDRIEAEIERFEAIAKHTTTPDEELQREFDRRVKAAELLLKEKQLRSKDGNEQTAGRSGQSDQQQIRSIGAGLAQGQGGAQGPQGGQRQG